MSGPIDDFDKIKTKLNRKQRRTAAKQERRKDLKPLPLLGVAIKNMVKAMKQSPRVQELVVSGKLDKWLGVENEKK